MKAILRVEKISKLFPGVKALTDITVDFYPGEVHSLVGENGAGKSTLIKIISGVYVPTEGQVILDGEIQCFKTPGEALDVGISVIHQELSIANDLSIAENVFLGQEPKLKSGFLDRKKMESDTQDILDYMGVDLKAEVLAKYLNAAQQQMIEIARIISKKSKIVIMDEPTSSLSSKEIESLFKQIKILKKEKVSIIYITHRLKELTEICERITVLRDGKKICSMMVAETTEQEIVSNMVGRDIDNYYDISRSDRGDEMLRVENLCQKGKFKNISFTAYAGEILGFAGLVGAGRTEVMEAVFGATKLDKGKILIKGEEVLITSPLDAITNKIGLVTEDRRTTGLMLDAQIKENIVLPSLPVHHKKLGFLDLLWEKNISNEYMNKLKIKAPSINTILRTLSGGNQQKVILSKWLIANSKILILDEPTRGIDVNARSEFYILMSQFVKMGGCIIMVSSELPEVIGISDRIFVMREGQISGELKREDATEDAIMMLASITSNAQAENRQEGEI